ncbi:MAG TPA: heparinase II/III family protein, partial [Anaerolineales bacterium]|nr:heparinase II/III family protein [Anaerolineales bacterium]
WTNWSRGKVLNHGDHLWQGAHDSYTPVTHKRTVMALENDRWLVVDILQDTRPHHYALYWLLNDFLYEQQEDLILLSMDSMKYKVQVGLVNVKPDFSVVRGDPNSIRGWRSRYYGNKEPAISMILEANQPRVCFWTFFGLESDNVEWVENKLEIGLDGTKTSVDLQSPSL